MANFWDKDVPVTQNNFWEKDMPQSVNFWEKDIPKSAEQIFQDKIKESYAKGLTDIRGIPEDIPPEKVLELRRQQQDYDVAKEQEGIGSKLIGAVEAPISVAGKLLGGLSGMAGKAVRGEMTKNNLGFEQGTAYGYDPRTIAGQEIVQAIPDVIQQSGIEGIPMLGELEALGSLRFLKGTRNIPSTFRPREIPVVGEAIQSAKQATGVVSKAIEPVVAPVQKFVERIIDKTPEAKTKIYNDIIDRYELGLADAKVKGISPEGTASHAFNEAGITEQRLSQAINNTGRNPSVPSTIQSANELLAMSREANFKPQNIVSKTIEPIASALRRLSPEIANRAEKYEFVTHNKTGMLLQEVRPFMEAINKLNKNMQNKIALELNNGNYDNVKSILSNIHYKEADAAKYVGSVDKVKNVLKNLHTELVDSGFKDLPKIENYYPRRMNDLEGLYKTLGIKEKGNLEKALYNKANSIGIARNELTDQQIADVVNKSIRGYGQKLDAGKPFFAKSRNISDVTENILPYYAHPIDTLENYIRSSVNSIEKNKFFGKDAVIKGGQTLNLDESIGNLLGKNIQGSGRLADEVAGLIKSRFVGGEQAASKGITTFRNAIYATKLANPLSAITQLGDLFTTAAKYGLTNTLKGLFKANEIDMKSVGLENVMAELSTPTGHITTLDNLMKVSGLKNLDKLGKNTNMNAGIYAGRDLAQTKAGVDKIRAKYGQALGKEFSKFIVDLKAGKQTPNVKYYAFSELNDVQPVSLLQMPKYYLDHPNGRIMYALKSYTIKQLDLMKRYIVDEYKRGNKFAATKNAVVYIGLISVGNTAVDQIKKLALGRMPDIKDLPDEMVFNILKTLGGSRYVWDKYLSQGKVGDAVLNAITPAYDMIQNPIQDVSALIEGKEDYRLKSIKNIPIVGSIIDNYFLGGQEKYYEQQDKKGY